MIGKGEKRVLCKVKEKKQEGRRKKERIKMEKIHL